MYKKILGYAIAILLSLILVYWSGTLVRGGVQDNQPVKIIFGTLLPAAIAWWAILQLLKKRLLRQRSAFIHHLIALPVALLAAWAFTAILSRSVATRPMLDSAYWETVSVACDLSLITQYEPGVELQSFEGYIHAVPGTAPYDSSRPGVHPIVMLTSSEWDTNDFYTTVPTTWNPESLASTELVLCMTRNLQENLGTCNYATARLSKMRYVRAVWLVEAATGELVAWTELQGAIPDCPGSISSGRTAPVVGDEVTVSEVLEWVQEYVER